MTEIARLIRESGKALQRHWSQVAPAIGLEHSNLLGDESPVAELLDMGAGIDFFVALRGGTGIAGIATRVQAVDYPTITLRNRSTRSELQRLCNGFLARDARLRPYWCVHLYEHPVTHFLTRFVAVRADDLAEYFVQGHPVGWRQNIADQTPFAVFEIVNLRHHGVDVRDGWYGQGPAYQERLP